MRERKTRKLSRIAFNEISSLKKKAPSSGALLRIELDLHTLLPISHLTLGFFLGNTVAFLNFSGKLALISFNESKVVVG